MRLYMKLNSSDMPINFHPTSGQLNDKISTHFFDYKGVVIVPPGGDLPNFEAAEEAAIMAEAEEVEETLDDEGNPVYQVGI